jgi:hypothetical protein
MAIRSRHHFFLLANRRMGSGCVLFGKPVVTPVVGAQFIAPFSICEKAMQGAMNRALQSL